MEEEKQAKDGLKEKHEAMNRLCEMLTAALAQLIGFHFAAKGNREDGGERSGLIAGRAFGRAIDIICEQFEGNDGVAAAFVAATQALSKSLGKPIVCDTESEFIFAGCFDSRQDFMLSVAKIMGAQIIEVPEEDEDQVRSALGIDRKKKSEMH